MNENIKELFDSIYGLCDEGMGAPEHIPEQYLAWVKGAIDDYELDHGD